MPVFYFCVLFNLCFCFVTIALLLGLLYHFGSFGFVAFILLASFFLVLLVRLSENEPFAWKYVDFLVFNQNLKIQRRCRNFRMLVIEIILSWNICTADRNTGRRRSISMRSSCSSFASECPAVLQAAVQAAEVVRLLLLVFD